MKEKYEPLNFISAKVVDKMNAQAAKFVRSQNLADYK